MTRYEPAISEAPSTEERLRLLVSEATTCRGCGAVVIDQHRHDEWHRQVDGLLGQRTL